MGWMRRRLVSRRRTLLCVACLLLAAAVMAAGVAQADDGDEFARRLKQLQKQLQEAINSGKPPPANLMQEIQKLMQQAGRRRTQEEGDWSPYGGDEGWRRVPCTGTITVQRNVNFSTGGDEKRLDKRETGFMRIQISSTQEVDVGGKTQLYPVGTVTSRISGRECWDLGDGSITRTYSFQGHEAFGYDADKAPQRAFSFEVNDEDSLCRLDTPMGNASGQVTSVIRSGLSEQTSTGEGSTDIAAWFRDGCCKLEDESFNLNAGILTGNYSMTGYQVIGSPYVRDGYGAVWPQGDPMLQRATAQAAEAPVFPITYRVTYSISTRDKRPRVVLEPGDGYAKWIPELAEQDEGNTISVTARIIDPPDAEGSIRFELRDVSKEPGKCLNHPTQNAQTSPDLKIPSAKNSEELDVAEGEQTAQSKDDVVDARVVVQADDWGAYGKLYAIATINLGGQDVEVPAVYEATGTAYLTLPKDEDDNSIADEWQRKNGVSSCGGDSDDDQRPEGRGPGDGLSVYEEYRGLRVQGKHQRLDPKIKDLFVYDQHDLVADSYLEAITEPLKVHYMQPAEMGIGAGGNGRVVNFNHDRYHLVHQHGLHVVRDQGGGRYNWGLCHGRTLGPPVTADPKVSIYVDQIGRDIRQTYQDNKNVIMDELMPFRPDEAWLQGHIRDATRMVTAHECCHGLGISHHLKTLPPGTTENEVNPTYGWLVCVMRYPWEGTTGSDAPKIKYVDEVIYIMQGKFPWGNRLCNTMDDCASQLVVSDEGY